MNFRNFTFAAVLVTVLLSISALYTEKKFSSKHYNPQFKLHCPVPPGQVSPLAESKNTGNSAGGFNQTNSPDISDSWQETVFNEIEMSEYNINYSEKLNSYQSPNRTNNMRFIYHPDGFTVKPRMTRIPMFDVNDKSIKEEDKKYETIEDWSIQFQINNFRIGMTDKLVVKGNEAHIENEDIRIDYSNTKAGMRQDFIVKNKPAASGRSDGKLRLDFTADTKLNMTVGADALMFKDKGGDVMLKYSSLKCWDANGTELRAYFEKQLQSAEGGTNYKLQIENKGKDYTANNICNLKSEICNSFSIVVNDENAIYPVTIDPLSTSPDWSKFVYQNFANFGWSVSTAGDVNGDGFSDVIIGVPNFDNGQTDEGMTIVYHGSAFGLTTVANWMAESDQDSAHFGNSVSTAGDVNGDGYSDVIVGAYRYDNGQTDEGRAYVYHGSSSGLSATANWTAESDQVSAGFGWSVSTAGDVNGDGYSDVIVGAYKYDNGQTDEGRTFVYHGSASGLSETSNWTAESNQAGAYFGNSVSMAGDVNGDGYSDVIVGAPLHDNGQFYDGRAHVYHGSATGLSATANWTTEERNRSLNRFGYSVSTAGDVNGDGYSDVIVGAADQNNFLGRAFVYHGLATGLSDSASWTYQIPGNFGYSVSTAGDVNGDGYSDVIVGAPYYSSVQTNMGGAFVFHGSASGLSATINWIAVGNDDYAYFGNSVSTAGDVNGDGYSDVIVGAYNYFTTGWVFNYNGSAAGLPSVSSWVNSNNQQDEQYGYSVSSAGDVNGDGYNDVLVSAPFNNGVSINNGIVYVYYGSSSGISSSPAWSASTNTDSAQFGISVSTAGDVNGDGYSDVIIGANNFTNDQQREGKVFVYHGSSSGLSSSPDWTAEGNQANCNFGISVSTAGDVNGDGYSDVIIGANLFDNGQTNEGKVFVYHGSPSGLQSSPAWEQESNNTNANFGFSVSYAGDVNGDGYSDVIIGAYNFTNGQTGEGRAFVYRGSSSGVTSASPWGIESNQTSAFFGWSVSSAGDVNGDGFSDVIVGVRNYDNGEGDEGRAYVFLGMAAAPGVSASANFVVESNQASAFMGWSVSSAGDVNGDGYSDVLVGIRNLNNGQTNEGQVRLYYGSPSGVTTANFWTAESNQANALFGQSVSSAGDVNGDGYSDVIIGAHMFSSEGRAFAYYGNERTGKNSLIKQQNPLTNAMVSSGGLTGVNGQVKLNILGKSPFGTAKGRFVYEYKENGAAFSSAGGRITNSVSSSGAGNYTDLGVTGIQLNQVISGLQSNNEYKWRARIQYDPVSNPYQKYGPWKYYSNYMPMPYGGFKPRHDSTLQTNKNLSMNVFIQGFYDATANITIADTLRVYLRNAITPYDIVDSAKSVMTSDGDCFFSFANAENSTPYYIAVHHRNSIETWSKTPQQFTGNNLNYIFSSAGTQAYGDNMIQVDNSPVLFAVYGGDVNQDGIIDGADGVLIDNDAANFEGGYLPTDLNGDEIIDGSDALLADNNAANFVTAIVP